MRPSDDAYAPYIYDATIIHFRQCGFAPKLRLETNYQQTIVNLEEQGRRFATDAGFRR